METIYKYDVNIDDQQTVVMPEGYKILSIQVQDREVKLWALVNPENIPVAVKIYIRGTGHPCKGMMDKKYISTFQMRNGQLVFHAFTD
ncbi:DUF7352 domain-containing protein [Sphingobacterium mizutaii]|uniref:DUF7352 domain-containing protein n=1 Tax=Sphingobacterium mizutaii TaxID=1010 RepID=UPI00289D4E16|nr:hypothetical protein [Sphingobacterium mizutaii]